MQQRLRPSAFTMIEVLVVIGILGLLAMMIFPALGAAKKSARVMQCTSQLRQLGQALAMYDIDHNREMENYPDRLTHLTYLGYAPDERIYVCPMDYTKAQAADKTLKPGNASDKKSEWAERISNGNNERNCSYLYEFSTRPCQEYDVDTDFWDSDYGFAAEFLVLWDEFGDVWYTEPGIMDRDGYNYIVAGSLKGMVTWQEAKFWQLNQGDAYTTGYSFPGEGGVPASWSSEPWDEIGFTAEPMRGYARTMMPIVRCFWHMNPELVDKADETKLEEVLNLALDGNTFYSTPGWEQTAWRLGHTTYTEEP